MLIEHATEQSKVALLKALGIEHDHGDPRWPLPNLKPSTEREYWGWRSSCSFRAEAWCGHKQIDGRWATLMLYFVGHSSHIAGGFAVAYFYEYGKEEVRYFTWGACDHDFSGRNAGHCLTRYKCAKCGASYDVDSSG